MYPVFLLKTTIFSLLEIVIRKLLYFEYASDIEGGTCLRNKSSKPKIDDELLTIPKRSISGF